jgi:hypothetical protein
VHMADLALDYPDQEVANPELLPVKAAAEKVGVHEMTVWRYLRLGFLTRYKSVPHAPRQTLVDVRELRRLRKHPPVGESSPD